MVGDRDFISIAVERKHILLPWYEYDVVAALDSLLTLTNKLCCRPARVSQILILGLMCVTGIKLDRLPGKAVCLSTTLTLRSGFLLVLHHLLVVRMNVWLQSQALVYGQRYCLGVAWMFTVGRPHLVPLLEFYSSIQASWLRDGLWAVKHCG